MDAKVSKSEIVTPQPLSKRVPPMANLMAMINLYPRSAFVSQIRKSNKILYSIEENKDFDNLIDREFPYLSSQRLFAHLENLQNIVSRDNFFNEIVSLLDRYSKSFDYYNRWGTSISEFEIAKDHFEIKEVLEKIIYSAKPVRLSNGDLVPGIDEEIAMEAGSNSEPTPQPADEIYGCCNKTKRNWLLSLFEDMEIIKFEGTDSEYGILIVSQYKRGNKFSSKVYAASAAINELYSSIKILDYDYPIVKIVRLFEKQYGIVGKIKPKPGANHQRELQKAKEFLVKASAAK